MSNLSHIKNLVAALTDATRKGTAQWSSRDEQTMYLATNSGSILLKPRDDDGAAPYAISVLNEQGNVIESFSSSSDWTGPEEDELEILVGELYSLARRKALNIDTVLNNIIREISSPEGDFGDEGGF